MKTKQAFGILLTVIWLALPSCDEGAGKLSKEARAGEEYRRTVQRLQQPQEVVALGIVTPEKQILDLSFEVSGKVGRRFLEEGESAAAGDLLIALDTDLEENELENLQTQLALNRLAQTEARAQIAYYEKVLNQQQQTHQRLKRSVAADALPASQLDQTELELLNSGRQLDQQQREVERLGLQEEQLRIRRKEVQLRRRQKEIRATGEGDLIRWDVRKGAAVRAFDLVGAFAPAGLLVVEAEVDEYFAGSVEVGQEAVIKREGFPDTLALGKVIFTAPNLSDKSILSEDNTQFEDLQVRRIKIRLEDGQELLLGMKIEAVIQTSEKR